MSKQPPTVSIGLPVFNGENYLAQTLESILTQSYRDFELIVSDNASTDRTAEICEAFAGCDDRIRYVRNASNVGAVENYNRVVRLASGRYFKWAAHDDLLHPDFLLRCVRLMERSPSVAICFSKVRIIDDHGQTLRTGVTDRLKRIGSRDPFERFADLLFVNHGCHHMFGLIRTDVLCATPLHHSFPGGDRAMLAELGLRGRTFIIPEDLFILRDHPQRSVKALPSVYLRAGWHDPAKRKKMVLPHWRLLLEYSRIVDRALPSRRGRLRGRLYLLRWMATNGNWARLALDLVVGTQPRLWVLHVQAKRSYRALRSRFRSSSRLPHGPEKRRAS